MVDIKLQKGQNGYDVVGEYIRRYWKHNIWEDVVVSLGISYDGKLYELCKQVASPYNFDDIEYLSDWWASYSYALFAEQGTTTSPTISRNDLSIPFINPAVDSTQNGGLSYIVWGVHTLPASAELLRNCLMEDSL